MKKERTYIISPENFERAIELAKYTELDPKEIKKILIENGDVAVPESKDNIDFVSDDECFIPKMNSHERRKHAHSNRRRETNLNRKRHHDLIEETKDRLAKNGYRVDLSKVQHYRDACSGMHDIRMNSAEGKVFGERKANKNWAPEKELELFDGNLPEDELSIESSPEEGYVDGIENEIEAIKTAYETGNDTEKRVLFQQLLTLFRCGLDIDPNVFAFAFMWGPIDTPEILSALRKAVKR